MNKSMKLNHLTNNRLLSLNNNAMFLMALLIAFFSVSSHAAVITDGDFVSWNYGSDGAAIASREISGGNPGARLNFTNTPNVNTVLGTAIKSDFSTISSIEGLSFNLQLDVLSGPGGFGEGQGISLLVEQNSTIYSIGLTQTGWPLNWDTLTFSGIFTESSFGLLSGAGSATPDFSGGVETFFGFSASNSSNFSYTLTQYYDNFSLEIVPSAVVPIPAAAWLFGSGLIGLVGLARRKKA